MNIALLGKLEQHSQIEEWLCSAPAAVPYFGGLKLPFIARGIMDDSSPADFETAVRSFFDLGPADRQVAGDYLFRLYRLYAGMFDADEFDFAIPNPAKVWDFVTPTEIHVSRRPRAERSVYVEILAECRWDVEHGVAIIYRGGSKLSRVSDQDGHLTTADAFDLPEVADTILYEG